MKTHLYEYDPCKSQYCTKSMRVINGKQRMCATVIRERELSDVEGHNIATHSYPKYRNTEEIVRRGGTQHSNPILSQIQKKRNT